MAKFAAGVVDTGGKFAAGVVDTSSKFATGVVIWRFKQAFTAWLQLRRSDERSPALTH